jgi:5'(3')-deoxyribonucleotidase
MVALTKGESIKLEEIKNRKFEKVYRRNKLLYQFIQDQAPRFRNLCVQQSTEFVIEYLTTIHHIQRIQRTSNLN